MIAVLILLVLAVFLLSNREDAIVAFWPFGPLGAASLGGIVLVAFALGVLAGMLLLVPHRIRAHRRARKAEKQVAAMQATQPIVLTPPTVPGTALVLPPSRSTTIR